MTLSDPTPAGQPAGWVPTPLRGEPIAGDWVTSPLLVGRWRFGVSLIPSEWLLHSETLAARTIAISRGDVASFEFCHAYPPEGAIDSTDVEVTAEMVAAAWKAWTEAGAALPYEGARVRDYLSPGMAPPERGAAITAMWDEDLRQAQANDDLMRRTIAAALAAI